MSLPGRNARDGDDHPQPEAAGAAGTALAEALSAAGQPGLYSRGTSLFRYGSRPTGVFLVRSGAVRVFVEGVDDPEVHLQTAAAGNLLGVGAVLCNERHIASAVVAETGGLTFVPGERFRQTLESKPQAAIELLHCLAYELRSLYQRLRALPVGTRRPRRS